ncbi:MAG: hypothetical protein H6718_14300 [Polyangiaceae bacterium]|nr:hypothetical protein [Polyangiaceae bacterium]MCB9606076.1 hypothetical protein [Polyangiaceae bacterium]
MLLELRATSLGLTVRIRWFQRVYAADAAVEELAAAGVPAFVRGVHLRSLFHAFGPYLPMPLFVESAQAEEARQLLDQGFRRERVS